MSYDAINAKIFFSHYYLRKCEDLGFVTLVNKVEKNRSMKTFFIEDDTWDYAVRLVIKCYAKNNNTTEAFRYEPCIIPRSDKSVHIIWIGEFGHFHARIFNKNHVWYSV